MPRKRTKSQRHPKRAHRLFWEACNCGCRAILVALLDARGQPIVTFELAMEDLAAMADGLLNSEGDVAPGVSNLLH